MRKNLRKMRQKILWRAEIPGLWKTWWKTWKSSFFPVFSSVFHRAFPESFQLWKPSCGGSPDVARQNSPLLAFRLRFHRLSRVFRRFCRWFSPGGGFQIPQKASPQAQNSRISGFPQSPHPLLRLLRPFYLLFCLSLFLCQRGEKTPECAKCLKIYAHANSSDKIPLIESSGSS